MIKVTVSIAAVEIAPKGLLRLAEPLLSSRVRAAIEKDYQKLKELLEK
ncbi:hypothetical protein JXA02_09540 [candidate division KSB1 bacterium]|nr:hypothetical protein [candidate division KSB1 bacterium]